MKEIIGAFALLVVGLLSGCGSATGDGSATSSNAMSSSVMLQNGTYTTTQGGGASQETITLKITPTDSSSFTIGFSVSGFSVSYPPNSYSYNAVLLSGSTQDSGAFFITSPTAASICYTYKFDPGTSTLYLAESLNSSDPQTSCNAVIDSNATAYVAQTMG